MIESVAANAQRGIPYQRMWTTLGRSVTGAQTLVVLSMPGNLATFTGVPNYPIPHASRLVSWACATEVTTDTTPGNWTVNIRRNTSATTIASFSVGMTTGITQSSGIWTPNGANSQIWQPGDMFDVYATGGSKTDVRITLTIGWMIL